MFISIHIIMPFSFTNPRALFFCPFLFLYCSTRQDQALVVSKDHASKPSNTLNPISPSFSPSLSISTQQKALLPVHIKHPITQLHSSTPTYLHHQRGNFPHFIPSFLLFPFIPFEIALFPVSPHSPFIPSLPNSLPHLSPLWTDQLSPFSPHSPQLYSTRLSFSAYPCC